MLNTIQDESKNKRLKSCTPLLTKEMFSNNVKYLTSENLLLFQKEHK